VHSNYWPLQERFWSNGVDKKPSWHRFQRKWEQINNKGDKEFYCEGDILRNRVVVNGKFSFKMDDVTENLQIKIPSSEGKCMVEDRVKADWIET
jgi:hypothetical protein